MWNLPHVLQKCADTRPYQRVYESMSLDSRLASLLYFLVLLRDLVFRLSVPVNRLTGTYTVDLRLPILPFTSFIGHFVPHSHFLLELNQSIVTAWSTVLMPVEGCRINPVNDRLTGGTCLGKMMLLAPNRCHWPAVTSHVRKGMWCPKKIQLWPPLLDSDTVTADEGSSVEAYILKKTNKNPCEPSIRMQHKEKERV